MNLLQILLLALFAAFVVLRLLGRGRTASRFARWTLLCLGAVVVLAPFTWLVAAVFQGSLGAQRVHLSAASGAVVGEDAQPQQLPRAIQGPASLTGPVYFWEYVLNSTVYATAPRCCRSSSVRWVATPWPSTSSAARMR